MQEKKYKGIFITFEGADGVGKTTQIALLHEYLLENNFHVLMTREPGGTPSGERIRSILLDPKLSIAGRTEALLYLAARAEHVENVILPALSKGSVVICDRFSDSTFVYQCVARGLPIRELQTIDAFAAHSLSPDRTFLLDAPTEFLTARFKGRGEADRMEKEGPDFQKIVREGFLALAKAHPERIFILDALRSVKEIHSSIRENIDKMLIK